MRCQGAPQKICVIKPPRTLTRIRVEHTFAWHDPHLNPLPGQGEADDEVAEEG
jgi:hypothetical protein